MIIQTGSTTSPKLRQTPAVPSQVDVGESSAGLRVERVPSRQSASEFSSDLGNRIGRTFRGSHLVASEATSEKPSREESLVQEGGLKAEKWIDLGGLEELDNAISADFSRGELPMVSNDLSLAGYLEAQCLLEKFIRQDAPTFVAHYKKYPAVWLGLSVDQRAYLDDIASKRPGLPMPHVMAMVPVQKKSESSNNPWGKYTFDISHFDLYRKGLLLDNNPDFVRMMNSLFSRIDTEKKLIFEKQRELTKAAIARGMQPVKLRRTRINDVSLLSRTHSRPASSIRRGPHSGQPGNIAGSGELDSVLRDERILPNESNETPFYDWIAAQRRSNSRTLQSVSGLAEGRPPGTTADLPRYQYGKLFLTDFIPKFAARFLRGLERIDAKNLLPKILTRAERSYLRDLAVKSPALTMPNVFNTVQPRSTEPNTDHYEAYRRDFDFKPSEYFLTIIESIWSEIDRQKRDIYYPAPTSANAEAALSATSSTPTAGH